MANFNKKISTLFEDVLYQKIIRNLLLMSKFGRQSVLGEAATGYNFDYMYQNKPSGYNPLGYLVDSILLNLPSVQATRNRRNNLIKILSNEVENNKISGKVTMIVDVACGTGRYLLDIAQLFKGQAIETVAVDYDKKSIRYGQALAKEYDVPETSLRFVRGNVFRLSLLKKFGGGIDWKPNIIVASGLTVYIDDNKSIDVMKNAYDALDDGGMFLFDSQENNPSRKLMEKIGKTKEGAWVLYYRKPNFWREWLHKIGFQDIIISRDQWNMYNLCTARKI